LGNQPIFAGNAPCTKESAEESMDDARLGDGMTIEKIGRQLEAIQSDLSDVKSDLAEVKRDVTELKGDVTELKGDVAGLKGDVTELKGDVAGLKGDVAGLKGDVAGLKGDVSRLDTKIDALDANMRIRFEETHQLIKMGFESVTILDEKVDRRFDETERQHADHRALIEAAVKRLGREAEARPAPAPRRR
jgi:chromosome segregation ATPase